jgi:hypothetical protein
VVLAEIIETRTPLTLGTRPLPSPHHSLYVWLDQ